MGLNKIHCCFLLFLFFSFSSFSQNISGGEVHGNFQADVQYYNTDSAIGAPAVPEKLGLNSFSNIIYTNQNFSAGMRFESYMNALQGFNSRYNGTGVPFRYATYKADELEVTAGNYYEQFGSGLIFRSYEEKNLGIDNSLEGIRVRYSPHPGISVKGIWGLQRDYWSKGPGTVRGADAEFAFNEMFSKLAEKKTRVILGGSVISKFQKDDDPVYNLPQNVAAFAGRVNITRGKINLYSEYAYKINDPSYVNNFIYKPGEALLINAVYSQKGLGISLGAKRIDNMNFRSDLNATNTDLTLSYLPALTKQHTYALAAYYPYATQPNGEFGFQGEIIYSFKKGSGFGGQYGTTISLNYSRANSIQKRNPPDTMVVGEPGTLGYSSDFLKLGNELYFEDYNFEISKKLSQKLKMNLDYLYLTYNKDVIQGSPGYGTIYSHTAILELIYKINASHTIRTEMQHLYTEKDQKSWAMALAEYSIAPQWFFAVVDLYNYGNSIHAKQIHYYNFSFGFTKKTNRITLGYGKQREGLFCVGGICRTVPASNGFTFSVSSSF